MEKTQEINKVAASVSLYNIDTNVVYLRNMYHTVSEMTGDDWEYLVGKDGHVIASFYYGMLFDRERPLVKLSKEESAEITKVA